LKSKGFDFLILVIILVVSLLGLSMIWSLEPSLFPQQLIFLLLSLGIFFLFSRIDFRIFENVTTIFYGSSLFLLLITFVLGEVTRGSIRWIQLGFINLQPSEIVKPFLIIFFASYFAKQEKFNLKIIFKSLILLLIPLILVFKQPDLGSTLVILVSFLGIVIFSRLPKIYLAIGTGIAAIFSPIAWFLMQPYQKDRIYSFFNPYADPLRSGYHIIQSIITVGSGGFLGRGLGKGTQSQFAFLPEHHTDFMFASLTEELGFLGASILLLCYFLLLSRILLIAQNSQSFFGKLVCYGVFSLLLFQIFTNIGMNMGIMPVTGITLPLVSYGGSSLLATLICFGIVESIARLQKRETTIEIS
jgi:rod shape determining protein RodA